MTQPVPIIKRIDFDTTPRCEPEYIGTSGHRRFVKALREREESLIAVFNAACDQREDDYNNGLKVEPVDWTKFHINVFKHNRFCVFCRRSEGIYEFDATLDGVKYVWPEKYLHYVGVHGVRPDSEFERVILNNQPHIRSTGIPKVARLL